MWVMIMVFISLTKREHKIREGICPWKWNWGISWAYTCVRERWGEVSFISFFNTIMGLASISSPFFLLRFLPFSFPFFFCFYREREGEMRVEWAWRERERGRELVPLVGRLFFELTCGTKEGGERQLIHSHVASFRTEEQKNIGIGKHRNMIGMQMQKRRIKNKEILHV